MSLFKISRRHSCGKKLVEELVPVNEKILSVREYPVDYCENCKIYQIDKYESEDREIIGDLITNAQAKTNLRNHNSIYTINHLEEIANKIIIQITNQI